MVLTLFALLASEAAGLSFLAVLGTHGNELHLLQPNGTATKLMELPGEVPWSGQVTFNSLRSYAPLASPYATSYFAWLLAGAQPTVVCVLFQYNISTNSSNLLLTLKGNLPFDMSYDPADGGKLWGLISDNSAKIFSVGFFSLKDLQWYPLVTLSGSSQMYWSFLSATIDTNRGLYYIIYTNGSTGAVWFATVTLTGPNKGAQTYRQFPDNISLTRRNINKNFMPHAASNGETRREAKRDPSGDSIVEFRYSHKTQQVVALCVNSSNAYYLTTLNPATLAVQAFKVMLNLFQKVLLLTANKGGDYKNGISEFGTFSLDESVSTNNGILYASLFDTIPGYDVSTGKIVDTVIAPGGELFTIA